MAHSYRDRMGGHHCSHVVGYDGDVYWTPGARRFLKRSMKRDQRRQARRITAEALRQLEADYQDEMHDLMLMEEAMFGDMFCDDDYHDFLDDLAKEEAYQHEEPYFESDWDWDY